MLRERSDFSCDELRGKGNRERSLGPFLGPEAGREAGSEEGVRRAVPVLVLGGLAEPGRFPGCRERPDPPPEAGAGGV